MPPRKKTADPDTAVTYVRVSTAEQADSGLGLESQRGKVRAACEARGWRILHEFADEGISAKTIDGRPGLLAALDVLDNGGAMNLVAAKLDRLSRSVHDFTGLMARASKRGWNVRTLDPEIDTSTASGEMMANIMASFAQFERQLIGERTSAALKVLRAEGKQLGRPQRASDEVIAQIVVERFHGTSLRGIADVLNAADVPTSQMGKTWYASSVAAVLARPDAQAALEAAAAATVVPE